MDNLKEIILSNNKLTNINILNKFKTLTKISVPNVNNDYIY